LAPVGAVSLLVVEFARLPGSRFDSTPCQNSRRKSPSEKCAHQAFGGVLVYCVDYKCAHAVRISADRWPDHVRLSDLEPLFVCQACGQRAADVMPDFDWTRNQRLTAQ
jgi:hypothetical protein